MVFLQKEWDKKRDDFDDDSLQYYAKLHRFDVSYNAFIICLDWLIVFTLNSLNHKLHKSIPNLISLFVPHECAFWVRKQKSNE